MHATLVIGETNPTADDCKNAQRHDFSTGNLQIVCPVFHAIDTAEGFRGDGPLCRQVTPQFADRRIQTSGKNKQNKSRF